MNGLTVGQLARAAGVGHETVRHYEQVGLLPKPDRSYSGYRLFAPDSLERMHFIRRSKALGFGLPEISELLRLSDQRQSGEPSEMVQLRQAAAAKLADVDIRIAELQRIREGLVALIASCPGKGTVRDCPILAALSDETKDQAPPARPCASKTVKHASKG